MKTYRDRAQYWNVLQEHQQLIALEEALNNLQPDTVKVLKLHYYEGYSLKEITRLIDRSITTVRNHHDRGIFKLRKHFGDVNVLPVLNG